MLKLSENLGLWEINRDFEGPGDLGSLKQKKPIFFLLNIYSLYYLGEYKEKGMWCNLSMKVQKFSVGIVSPS